MMIALVAMFVMTMSANAQSEKYGRMTFDQLSSYLELRVDQVEPVKTAMAQFTSSMEAATMDGGSRLSAPPAGSPGCPGCSG